MRLPHPRPPTAYFAAALLLVLITWVDWITGYELGLFVFYFAPVSLAAWYGTRRAGILSAVAAAACWYASDRLSHHPYSNALFIYWETAMRLISFLTTALTLSTIQRTLAEQEDLLRMVSHDLRAPLAALRGHADLLRRRAPDGFSTDRADAILRSAASLDAMIGDLVDGARARGGGLALSPRPLELRPWAAEVLARAGGALEVARVGLEAPEGAPVRALADPERLERVLVNLVSNALKYSPPGSPVRVEVRPAGARAVLAVIDAGPGIPDGELAHLFERYRRGQATAGQPGLGLGLFTARRLVEAMGGRLTVARGPGGGAAFRVDLPAA